MKVKMSRVNSMNLGVWRNWDRQATSFQRSYQIALIQSQGNQNPQSMNDSGLWQDVI